MAVQGSNANPVVRNFPKILTYIVLTLGAFVMVLPFIWMLLTSVKIDSEIFGDSLKWLPSQFDFQNYSNAFTQTNMGRLFANTVFVTAVSVFSQVILGSMAGYAFARLHFKGKNILFFSLLATMMVPFEVLIIPVFLFVRAFPLAGGNNLLGQGGTGLFNTYAGLIFPNLISVFSIFLFRQFYLRFPHEIEEAAIVDGCSRAGVFWRILLPNSRPVMATMALFAFLWSWNDFLWPLVVVKKDALKTLQLGLSLFNQEQGTQWAELMAASTMAVVPVIILYLVLQGFLTKGAVTSGID
ncbi:MAG: carbohydrate ABC transporter permease [Trueperaceae bacterium]|nr:carbohydrate ABC transporter permease [Trueperaceae bacterium]